MNNNHKENIAIRKLRIKDRKNIAKYLNNKKIWDNLRNFIPFPYYEKDAENFINLVKNDKFQQVFAIEYNNEFCGIISLNLQKDIYEKSAEIGYWLGEPFWGKGIASRAVALITNYGFSNFDIQRIYAIVFENNEASMNVLKKNGFINEGILRKAIYKNNVYLDEHRYYKLRP